MGSGIMHCMLQFIAFGKLFGASLLSVDINTLIEHTLDRHIGNQQR